MAWTMDQFAAFFQAKKNGTYKCPFCSNEQFAVNGAPPGNAALLTLLASPANNPPPGVSHGFYSFACTNCGHTDFFHQNQVDRWIAENPGATNG